MVDLTIIIPHYNTPNYLEELLKTIPIRENIQVIVIDDNSDTHLDEYNKLINSAEFRHIAFLKNTDRNKGAGSCRNIGLQHATGDWVLFADADDLFIDGFYSCVEEFFAGDCDVIFFMPTSIDRDTKRVSKRHLYYKGILEDYKSSPVIKNELQVRYLMGTPWSKLIKRELIKANNIVFDEVLVSNDIAFSTKLGFRMRDFFVSCKTIYCVTNSKSSLTRRLTEENYDTRLNVFLWRYGFLKSNLTNKEIKMLDKLNLLACKELLSVFKYKLGFGKLLKVKRIFKSNKISVFHKQYLNPVFWFSNLRAIKFALSTHKNV